MTQENRYIRQQILPEIGIEGQTKLSNASVVIIGAGGLGCPVLSYLAGAGIGDISIIDPDIVEGTNLHRQPLYTMQDIGKSKAQSAANALAKYNPEIQIKSYVTRLDPSNVEQLCQDADVIIDAADSFAVTYTLSDYCFENKKTLISASVLGFKGYVAGFCGPLQDKSATQNQAPSVRAVFPNLPASAQNCSTAGVSGPAVGVLGSLQAQLAMNAILQLNPSPLGRMINLDLHQLTTSTFSFVSAPEPGQNFNFISSKDITENDSVIDLRTVEETPHTLIPTAHRTDVLNVEKLADELAMTPQKDRVVICCKSGLRAWNAGLILQEKGCKNIALIAVG